MKPSDEEKEAETKEAGTTKAASGEEGGKRGGGEEEDVALDFFDWEDEVKTESNRPKKVNLIFYQIRLPNFFPCQSLNFKDF